MSKIVVLFEVKPTKQGMDKYLELAAQLKPMLSGESGFISGERFQSLNNEGKLLSMSIWNSEKDIEKWRNNLQHKKSQEEGKAGLFESYNITICNVIREYSNEKR